MGLVGCWFGISSCLGLLALAIAMLRFTALFVLFYFKEWMSVLGRCAYVCVHKETRNITDAYTLLLVHFEKRVFCHYFLREVFD